MFTFLCFDHSNVVIYKKKCKGLTFLFLFAWPRVTGICHSHWPLTSLAWVSALTLVFKLLASGSGVDSWLDFAIFVHLCWFPSLGCLVLFSEAVFIFHDSSLLLFFFLLFHLLNWCSGCDPLMLLLLQHYPSVSQCLLSYQLIHRVMLFMLGGSVKDICY